jgi:hypothetical protein
MTSLEETLPILDLAVPALPGRVTAVAREADSLEEAAREAVAAFQRRRADADALAEQVRQALEAFRDQAVAERQEQDDAVRTLGEAAEDETLRIDESAGTLRAAGEQAAEAFAALQSRLDRCGDETRTALEEAERAVRALDERTRAGRAELEQAAGEIRGALVDVKQSISEGRSQVEEGVRALADAMDRHLAKVQARLDRTLRRLDVLRDEQADDVADTLAGLAGRREQVEEAVSARVEEEPTRSLQPQLESLESALADLGQQLTDLRVDVQGRREALDPHLAGIAERIEPLRGAVSQVKRAAEQVGITWP